MSKRILVHDYPGHPFQVQLSRKLAERGHQVLHLYAGYNVTPRGELTKKSSDPETFDISPIFIRKPLKKYSFVQRWFQEREYGRLLVAEINKYKPDIFISSNTPLDAQVFAQKIALDKQIKFIFWLQDVNGIAARKLLRERIPLVGDLIGRYYERLEQSLLQKSDHIVLITDGFQPIMERWGIANDQTTVIPNWAPIDSISQQPKNNRWSQEHRLFDHFCFMYTGTLGMKHNPGLLSDLAVKYQKQEQVKIVVISEGPGADWLQNEKQEKGLDNLILFPYQPFEVLPLVMGTADVLIALLEPEAGVFSVPSKVLSYLCAKRPLLLAIPEENLASQIVFKNNAGFVVPPNNKEAFIEKADILFEEENLRDQYANNGRLYAEENFNIDRITDKFEIIFKKFF